MRKLLIALPFLIACGGSETPPADEPAAAMAMLTEADVAGTWQGTATMEGTDSVFMHWTQTCGSGSCTATAQESPDTMRFTYTIAGDSSVGASAPMADPSMGGTMITDTWIARVANGMVTGTGMIRLADRPDSVVMRYRFSGSRVP